MAKFLDIAKTRIGWIGTGVMGSSMLGHLLDAGWKCNVFTRTAKKMDDVVSKGAVPMSCPKEVAEHSDVIFSIVGMPSDVKEVYFGDSGIIKGVKPDSILIDMTTSAPALAQEIFDTFSALNVSTIDAPVSGGDVGARMATLSIMVGGTKEAVECVMPLFKCMGKSISHMGESGTGQHTKMVNQILIATNMIGVVEGLLYASKVGLDLDDVIKAVGSGAAGSWSINNLGPRIVKRDFEPGFFVEHFLKDLSIALAECQRMGLCVPGLALAHQLYTSLKTTGYAKKGTQALSLVFEKMNQLPDDATSGH